MLVRSRRLLACPYSLDVAPGTLIMPYVYMLFVLQNRAPMWSSGQCMASRSMLKTQSRTSYQNTSDVSLSLMYAFHDTLLLCYLPTKRFPHVMCLNRNEAPEFPTPAESLRLHSYHKGRCACPTCDIGYLVHARVYTALWPLLTVGTWLKDLFCAV